MSEGLVSKMLALVPGSRLYCDIDVCNMKVCSKSH